jgi:hypothetical protein
MNDVLTRAACDFEDDTCRRHNIAKDIENEIAIPYRRRCVLAVIGHLPHTFNSALAPLRRRAFVAEVSGNSVRRVYGTASLSHHCCNHATSLDVTKAPSLIA